MAIAGVGYSSFSYLIFLKQVLDTGIMRASYANIWSIEILQHKMNSFYKKQTKFISDKEFSILEVINNFGPCNPWQVKDLLPEKTDLLLTMRTMHNLVSKNLLERIVISGEKLYKTKENYPSIRETILKYR